MKILWRFLKKAWGRECVNCRGVGLIKCGYDSLLTCPRCEGLGRQHFENEV